MATRRRNRDSALARQQTVEDELHVWRIKNDDVRRAYPDDEHVQTNCDRMDKAIAVMVSLVQSRQPIEVEKPDYYFSLVLDQMETMERRE